MFKYFNGLFYPYTLMDRYIAAGTWPNEGVDVDSTVFSEFSASAPEGKVVGTGSGGMPVWVDAVPESNDVLLHRALNEISVIYQKDINELNQAYLAAMVSDGPNETVKQEAVRAAIDERKLAYASDKASAREKYPV